MKKCFSFFIAIVLILISIHEINAKSFENETLNYKVLFKWGLVQKQAGRATLQLTETSDFFVAKLYARSENWADKFYKLRDTLITHMHVTDMLPVKYQRIAHENGGFAHDIIEIQRNIGVENSPVKGIAKRIRQKKNSDETIEDFLQLEAQGATVDMLSSFYFIRNMDFDNISPGYAKTINIFSGKKKELLTIKYVGQETLELSGKKYPTYKVTFSFTSDNKQKSSDDIETWIWANDKKIPLKLEGKLKVGKIRCLYTGD